VQGFVPDAAVSGERGTQDSNLESPVLETTDPPSRNGR
jgi:hypothetical protein